MSRSTLVVVSAGDGSEHVFADLYDDVHVVRHEDTVLDDSVHLDSNTTVVFEGGTDIDPRFYQEIRGSWTDLPDEMRDRHEFALFHRAQRKGASIIGICRGAQLCCVAADGKLIQHVAGHRTNSHMVALQPCGYIPSEFMLLKAAADHHQLMFPHVLPADRWTLLGWPYPGNIATRYFDQFNMQIKMPGDFREPEIIWFRKEKALAIQPHPEWMNADDGFPRYCQHLVKKLILEQQHNREKQQNECVLLDSQ
jgi:gamma-glutamyl-gamma-aminobutyrate hydrolase PuuD